MTTAVAVVTTSPCWVCRSSATSIYRESGVSGALRPDDMRITDSRYGTTVRLWRCHECGFVFADPEQIQSVVSLYQALEDPEYEAGAEVRTLQMSKLLAGVLRERPAARSLLDIGAGIGLLVSEAGRRGLDAEGVEPSRWAVELGRARFGAALHCGVFPHSATSGRTFDVITLVDVIEHVEDPVELLTDVRTHLAAAGVALVVTPDVSSVAAKLLGDRWWHYRLAHIGYFDDRSMKRAFAVAGLSVVRRRRARWYFTLGYLTERLAVYAPVLRGAQRRLAGGVLSRRTVPLNLFDSWCYMVKAHE